MSKKILFAIIIIVFCMAGCGEKTEVVVTKEEAVQICEDLFSKADEVYTIFYMGLPTEADTMEYPNALDENEMEQFYPVISDEYQSIDDIKAFTESVFTDEFAEENFYIYLEESENTESGLPLYQEVDGVLCKNANNGGKGWGLFYHPETLEILSQDEDTLVLEMETTLFDEPDEKGVVTLRNKEGKWLLDSTIH